MCSLGHREEAYAQPSQRVTRRRAETGSSAGPARLPRPRRATGKQLMERRKGKHAELRDQLTKEKNTTPFDAEQLGFDNLEPLPRDMQQLPDHLIAERIERDRTEPRYYWQERD